MFRLAQYFVSSCIYVSTLCCYFTIRYQVHYELAKSQRTNASYVTEVKILSNWRFNIY